LYYPTGQLLAQGQHDAGKRSGKWTFHSTGKRIWPRIIATELRSLENEAREKAGITRHITCHVFRHSIATHLLRNGVDIRYVQAFLGHEKLQTTQIYTRVVVADLVREIRRTHPRDRMRVPLA
jgi:site-specific recombinase XerD